MSLSYNALWRHCLDPSINACDLFLIIIFYIDKRPENNNPVILSSEVVGLVFYMTLRKKLCISAQLENVLQDAFNTILTFCVQGNGAYINQTWLKYERTSCLVIRRLRAQSIHCYILELSTLHALACLWTCRLVVWMRAIAINYRPTLTSLSARTNLRQQSLFEKMCEKALCILWFIKKRRTYPATRILNQIKRILRKNPWGNESKGVY